MRSLPSRHRRRARSRPASRPCRPCRRASTPRPAAGNLRPTSARWSRTTDTAWLSSSAVGGSEWRNCSVSRTQPMSTEHRPSGLSVADDELGRTAADVDDEVRRRVRCRLAVAPRNSSRASSSPRAARAATPQHLLGRVEELVAVARVARRARRRRADAFHAEIRYDCAVLAQHRQRALDRVGMQRRGHDRRPGPSRVIRVRRSTVTSLASRPRPSTSATSRRVELVPMSTAATRVISQVLLDPTHRPGRRHPRGGTRGARAGTSRRARVPPTPPCGRGPT